MPSVWLPLTAPKLLADLGMPSAEIDQLVAEKIIY
jgi:hypothetical protein